MKRIIIIVLPLIVLISIITIALCVGVSNFTLDAQESDDEQKQDETTEYMTEEEIVELFYENFDTFNTVAQYALNTEGVFYCGGNLAEMVLGNGNDILNIEDIEIGEQIKTILSFGFIRIEENETETNIYFHTRHSMGTQGVIYTTVEPRDKTIPQLDKKDWYYFFFQHHIRPREHNQ